MSNKESANAPQQQSNRTIAKRPIRQKCQRNQPVAALRPTCIIATVCEPVYSILPTGLTSDIQRWPKPSDLIAAFIIEADLVVVYFIYYHSRSEATREVMARRLWVSRVSSTVAGVPL